MTNSHPIDEHPPFPATSVGHTQPCFPQNASPQVPAIPVPGVADAALGIHEFFLFDPTHDYLDPPLQGNRLVGDEYERISPDAQGRLLCAELGLRLQDEGGQLVFYRSDTGERLLTAEEARRAEAEARRAEAEARRAAEAEVARLREELRRLRGT